tara:strand:+ start:5876 stop:6622 length:747 start_codon:yes stop_codon:yes gene_type:complete
MAYTLTYSENANGWPSFYSFVPEKMIGMNNVFYSFKGGNLYKHNSNSVDRNNFYGNPGQSTLSGVINIEPTTIKKFKTISLEGNSAWNCSVYSDLESGYIDRDWFSLKEGEHYAYIRRRVDDDIFEARSAQGIGSSISVDSSVITSILVTFSFDIGTMISVDDKVYSVIAGVPTFVGTISATTSTNITINGTGAGVIPTAGQFMMYIRNNIAESYGATGYYLAYSLTNDSTSFVELYGISSNLFKSYP